MLAIYRSLLYLYPSAYRDEFAEEMISVFREMQAGMERKGLLPRAMACSLEVAGLLRGALREHVQNIIGSQGYSIFPSRRLTMHSEFRFPKTTVPLMAIILGGIIMAIDKARAIQASVPYANPRIGPVQPVYLAALPSLLLIVVIAGVAGAIGWAALFALQRSGVQRFSKIDPLRDPRSSTKLSA
jgi:hypothetical protein